MIFVFILPGGTMILSWQAKTNTFKYGPPLQNILHDVFEKFNKKYEKKGGGGIIIGPNNCLLFYWGRATT